MGPSFTQASILATTLIILSANAAQAAGEVNVYSNRPAELVRPLLDAFTKQTGIGTNLLYLDQGLVERIQSEGEYSPADVILTVDDSRLNQAKQGGVTQALTDAKLDAEIPAKYRDSEGHWFGLTLRPRVFYLSAATAGPITYEELSQPEWKSKVCLRDGRHASNIGLFASMLDLHGETFTEKWLTGLKGNLARKPRGNDRSQVEAVAKGECALAIGNTEYLAAMIAEPTSKDIAGKVKVVFPNSEERGTSVGISGMALAKFAPNRDNAVALMEFLAGKPAQELYSLETNEYPVLSGAKPSKILSGFGPWKAEDVAMSQVSKLRKQALGLVEKIQFNDGPVN